MKVRWHSNVGAERSRGWVASALLGLVSACSHDAAPSSVGASTDSAQKAVEDSTNPGAAGGQGGDIELLQSGGGDAGVACAATHVEAQQVPVTLAIMFDRSGSMSTNQRWERASAALSAFVADPKSAGLQVALSFFPADGCNKDSCNSATACSVPQVEVGLLTEESAPDDAQEFALLSAIENVTPDGSTPMSIALDGALQWSILHKTENPQVIAATVLVTDGIPSQCNTDHSAIINLADDAFMVHQVRTFAIGLSGAEESFMGKIALAGGTQAPFMVEDATTATGLLDALHQIRGATVACDLAMPVAEDGAQIDPEVVKVSYGVGEGSKSLTLLNAVADAQACGADGGWHYDDPEAPTLIRLCPSTCNALRQVANLHIDIEVGCVSNIN